MLLQLAIEARRRRNLLGMNKYPFFTRLFAAYSLACLFYCLKDCLNVKAMYVGK